MCIRDRRMEHAVLQTNFTPSAGNALQACVASIMQLPLEAVPNFIEAPEGYLCAAQKFLGERGLCLLKVPLREGYEIEFGLGTDGEMAEEHAPLCLVAGGSPRGDHKHVVVGRLVGSRMEFMHDPHPEGGMLSENAAGAWAGFLVALHARG
eukprot:TRINITY_DN51936_c0_g1_i2.p1 TRINITY_DN51936_c0_g1~~TRINITY_DN51936_c0_g1_i2.p1  ORF type:complete len:151 (+),score=37.89 TRINITY_DN51936_c0_g1_i2:148-600(+)